MSRRSIRTMPRDGMVIDRYHKSTLKKKAIGMVFGLMAGLLLGLVMGSGVMVVYFALRY